MDALPSSQARYINQDPIHALRNEFYGQSGAPDAGRGPAKGVVVFSYAPEEVLRQAKLEAMEIKIRRKMLEQKAAQGDSHALRELTEGPVVDIAKLAELGGGGKHAGGRDQVKALVVPPELTEHGEEIRGSSKVIIKGEKRDFQRLGGAGGAGDGSGQAANGGGTRGGAGGAGGNVAAGGRPTPVFRTTDVGERLDAATSARKKHGGSPTRGIPARRKERRPVDPLKKQLRDGMLTYVPVKFEKPEGVGRAALVTQAQALSEAQHEYDAVKPRRPTSAPLRRYMSIGAATGASSSMRAIAAAAALAEAGDFGGAGGAGRGGVGGGLGGGLGLGEDKWGDVPLVRVQETDLLATYRAKSQRLVAAALAEAEAEAAAARQAAPPPPPGSPRPMRATIRSDSFSRGQEPGAGDADAAATAAAAAAAAVGAGVAGVVGARSAAAGGKAGTGGRAMSPGRRGTGSGSVPATAAEAAAAGGGGGGASTSTPNRRGHTVTVIEPHEEPTATTTTGGSRARGAAAGAAAGAGVARSPYAASAARNAAAQAAHAHAHEHSQPQSPSSPGLPPKAPRRSADSVPAIGLSATAAATAAMSARNKSSRPASAIAAASNSSAWAAAPPSGSGAGGATRVWSAQGASSSPPRVGSALRRPASASAASSGGGGGGMGSGKSLLSAPGGAEGFGMPRQTYQPPDPESRRAIQSRPGSAVGTAKTNNRIRGPARSPSHLAASYSGPVASLPPWAEGAAAAAAAAAGLDSNSFTSRSLSGSLLASTSLSLPHPLPHSLPQPGDPWATPSTSFPDAADRAHLQERILGGLARQYAMNAEETAEALAAAGHGAHAVAAAAGAGGASRRSGGGHLGMTAEEAAAAAAVQRTAAAMASAGADGGGGGGGGGGRMRPQSAPNRRLRPPSAGHWAGRPDPESVRRSLVKSGATHVYDPEVQPTPVDNYMNSLVGLD